MKNTITVDGISKKIKNRTILDNISLTMESGNIYGFVGHNGSGKTMLFRAISGLMSIDSGSIRYNDLEIGKDVPVIPSLGMTLENAGMYSDFTGFKNLKILAGIKGNIGNEQIRAAIKRVGLNPDDKRTFRKYSLGMKQRLALAQAFMESPDVLMLDEPTNALDAEGIEQIRNIILEEKQRGAIVLIASHNKEDIGLLTDYVYSISDGQVSPERKDKTDE